VYIIILNIVILLAIDILSFLTIRSSRLIKSPAGISILKIAHILLSLFTWLLFILILVRGKDFDENKNISLMLYFGMMGLAIFLPRFVIILFSNLAYLLRKRLAGFSTSINYAGMLISALIILLVTAGTIRGRFNFKYTEYDISYDKLPAELDGFRIIHLSDMHLSSFHNKEDRLREAMEMVNSKNPSIIVYSGDFVTISWKEMSPFTSILASSVSRYGNFAIPGNHDAGTYHPHYSEEDRAVNVIKMDSLIEDSGYTQLKDSSVLLKVDDASIKIAGVITGGRIPDISFGDLDKALGQAEADFTILLSHDPNHWYYEIGSSDAIDLVLSGHTHGAQFGIRIGKFSWSPASWLYPAWGGLYNRDKTYLYVNRGLGTISLPTRIGMPPEITVINLCSSD